MGGSDEKKAAFCDATFGITFPLFSQVSLRKSDIHPLLAHLSYGSADPEVLRAIEAALAEHERHLRESRRAARLMGFFFGQKMARAVEQRGTAVIPDWTGLWTRTV